jgi:hypothetical protein
MLKNLILGLALSSSAAASAAPCNEAPPPASRHIKSRTLATDLSFDNRGHRTVVLGSSQKYRELQIAGDYGFPLIQKVVIQFANGQTQTVENIDREVGGNKAPITIDLDGTRREIVKVTVYGGTLRYRNVHRANGTFSLVGIA